jgi:hypothetical protein
MCSGSSRRARSWRDGRGTTFIDVSDERNCITAETQRKRGDTEKTGN